MQLERAAVNAGKEIPSKPGNDNHQRPQTTREECDQESTPVMETNFQHAAIAATKSVKGRLKPLLEPHQRIAAGSIVPSCFLSPQQILRHCRNNGPRQEIRRQHGEDHRLGEWHEQISRDPGQQEHRSEHDADRKRGHESRSRDLRRAVENNFVHILIWLRLPVAIDVLNFDRGVIHQNADRQSEPTERHDVDCLPDRAEHNDGGQDCQRDRGRDDDRTSPTAEKGKNHERRQAGGDQRFPDHSADRATNKNRLIRQGSYLQGGWNLRLD